MMTRTEAFNRIALANAQITRGAIGNGTWLVWLNEFSPKEIREKAYETDDLEDAVFAAQTMRRNADSLMTCRA